jgi:hypothetical protein
MFCLYFFRFHRKDITEFVKKYKSGKREKVDQPVANQPVASKPLANQPLANQPVASKPKEKKTV